MSFIFIVLNSKEFQEFYLEFRLAFIKAKLIRKA